MPLARPLADAGEHGDALVALDHGVDQLHHQHGLADARAAEHRGLAALRERREQVDHLDAGGEQFGRPGLGRERRRLAVDRPARRIGRQRRPAVADPAEHVHEAPERRLADRDGDRAAGAARSVAAPQARGRLERDGAGGMRVEMGLDFGDDDPPVGIENFDGVLDRRRGALERQVDHGAANGDDRPLDPLFSHRKSLLASGRRELRTGAPATQSDIRPRRSRSKSRGARHQTGFC